MTTESLALAAAQQIAAQLPSSAKLTAKPLGDKTPPDADAPSIRTRFVGSTSADITVIPGDSVAAALKAAGDDASLADIIQPAIQAAVDTIGEGVLDNLTEDIVGDISGTDSQVFALVDKAGKPRAWCLVRIAEPATTTTAAAAPRKKFDLEAERTRMNVLRDIDLDVTVVIGRTKLSMHSVLDMVPGTVVELDRAAGAPADIVVNGRRVAHGEIVVVDEEYAVRVTDIISTEAGQ